MNSLLPVKMCYLLPIYNYKGAKNIGQVICVPDDFFGNDEQCEGGYNGYNALIFVYSL